MELEGAGVARDDDKANMGALDQRTEECFIRALDLEDDAREAFIAEQDPGTAGRLRALLAEFSQFDRLVEAQAASAKGAVPQLASLTNAELFADPDLIPGLTDRIGPYRILRKIGQGGMGVVYLAQQENPTREVAIKIIPRKQVSPHFLARFEAEYQALALMSHHHIARLYDAGATADGNAYFCMEYIEGDPIIAFCRKHRLGVAEKLKLFLQVCSGMQHAHQKAIVHRDLKPSNILVALDDDEPTAKIIDFGLAKGLAKPLSAKSMDTHLGTLAGTPAYMSPEQLMGNPDEVDTRGDIYALGVILYEMLADTHPFDLEALSRLPLDEALRHLRTVEPPRPSVALRKAGRPTLPADLDHITLKAMGKQLRHRYPSVHALREDIDNYLEHRPVTARAHSNLDVFLKFVRRNRVFIAATTMTLAALLAGLALSISSSIKANHAREQTQATLHFLQDVLAAPNPSEAGRDVKVVDLLASAERRLEREQEDHPELEMSLRVTLGNTYFGLGLYDDAEIQLRRALSLSQDLVGPESKDTLRIRYFLARVLRRQDDAEEAIQTFYETWQAQRKLLGQRHPETLQSEAGYAMALRFRSDHQQAEAIFREVWRMQSEVLGPRHRDTLVSLVGLANACYFQDKLAEATEYYRQALDLQRSVLGADAPETLATSHALANNLLSQGDYATAEKLFRETANRRERVLGPNHSETTSSLYSLGRCLFYQERHEEAAEVFADVWARRRDSLGIYHSSSLRIANRLALEWRRMGRLEDAAGLLESCIPEGFEPGGAHPKGLSRVVQNLGDIYLSLGRNAEALLCFQQFLQMAPESDGEDQEENSAVIHYAMALCYQHLHDRKHALEMYCQALELVNSGNGQSDRREEIEQAYRAFLNER